MCQMEIHAHAETTTMVQAVAHNLATSANDMVTLATVLRARGEDDAMVQVINQAREATEGLQRCFMALYERAVAEHPYVAGHGHDHSHEPVGSERDLPASTPA